MLNTTAEKAWANIGLDHVSHSQLSKPLPNFLFEYVYLNSRRKDMRPNCNMFCGTLAHDYIQAVAAKKQPLAAALKDARRQLSLYAPRDEADAKLKDQALEQIGDVVENGVGVTRELVIKNPEIERKITFELEGVAVPVLGYVDLIWENNFLEIKTKWRKKNGGAAPMPKVPSFNHTLQCAIYWKATGLHPRLLYVRDMNCVLFDSNNCESLTTENMERLLEYARQIAIQRQNLLRISTDFDFLKTIIPADWESMYWNIDPEYLVEAKNIWKL